MKKKLSSRRTRKMLEPNLPSQADARPLQAEEHGHFRQSDMPSGVEIHLDYCFPGEEDQDFKLTILVARDRGTKMTMSSVAPSKTCGEFIAKRVVAFMKEIGADQGDITIKSDQEPALRLVRIEQREVAGEWLSSRAPLATVREMVLSRERSSQCRIVPPRAFNTSQEDYQRHGFTQKCPGCRAILLGTTRQKHSEACRQRMADEEKVRTAKRKRQEFMKIAMEVQEKDNIEKDDVVAEGRHYQVGGSSSSASALGESDVVMRTQAKRDRSEDDGTDLTERLNKRAKEMGVAEEMEVSEIIVNQEDETESWSFGDEAQWAMDDRSGRAIDVELVKEARAEEVTFMESLPVWEVSGRDGEVLIRSRLVARDFKSKHAANDVDVFAAMPPLEAKRLLLRMAMVSGAVEGDEKQGPVKLMFVDVKKAHLSGRLKDFEFAYVSLPKEAGGGVGRLRRWLCGMRSAASAWEDDYVEHLCGECFVRGRSAPTVMLHEQRGIRLVVWSDDFTFLGRYLDLKWVAGVMTARYEIKIRAVSRRQGGEDPEQEGSLGG